MQLQNLAAVTMTTVLPSHVRIHVQISNPDTYVVHGGRGFGAQQTADDTMRMPITSFFFPGFISGLGSP
jgi:hypothetical protein